MRKRLAPLAAAALALLAAAPAAAQEDAPLDVDFGGGVTIRLLASGGSSWGFQGDTTDPASPFAAGGSVAVDLWNRERSFATRLQVEGGAYGAAIDAGGLLAFGDRWDEVKPYGFAGLSLASMNGGGGLGAVVGLGLQLDVAGPLSLTLEARFRGGGGGEDDEGNALPGHVGASILAGLGFTF